MIDEKLHNEGTFDQEHEGAVAAEAEHVPGADELDVLESDEGLAHDEIHESDELPLHDESEDGVHGVAHEIEAETRVPCRSR